MPRIFTGLEVPEALREDLASLRGGLMSARWIEPEDYHLTLRFVGDVDERTANEIADLLYAVRKRSIEVTLTGLGAFGGDRPRSIFVAVRQTQPLMELQAEHERIMRRVGLSPEPRKFVPHITLARLGRDATARTVADWLALRGLFMSRTFIVPSFALFSSKESVGGGPYLVEETYPLAA
ncbi:RNA 2',3'-cyclic phosphodiesterase [Phreatobacter sp.]|uniref:RNA 2',3'-cyclic phosphodiesterase n=1 Tax=Phreatobacter sp. TaxID=1966341 RepID=UPI0025EFFD15|nr:RNA 2',3'-cyclic phosphodiesterase [Phreatobacter sp.]